MTALDANNNRVGKFNRINEIIQMIHPNNSRGLAEEDRRKYIERTFAVTKKQVEVTRKVPADATDSENDPLPKRA